MAALVAALRVLVPVAVTLYVLYLVVFLTTAVAVQAVAVLAAGPWVAQRLVNAVREHFHHLT